MWTFNKDFTNFFEVCKWFKFSSELPGCLFLLAVGLVKTRCFREAYTGLPVVRITENQKALNCVVLNYSIPISEE